MKNINQTFDKEQLQKELDEKITNSFMSEDGFIDYMGQTLKSFAFRYLPTHAESRLNTFKTGNYFGVESFENNMGNAFKIADPDIKSGVKHLAKTVPMSDKPHVRYRLGIDVIDLSREQGELLLIAEVHWGFPDFVDNQMKQKKLKFEFSDLHAFRKQLALKLEEIADLFI